jgi:hypothetical protein
MIHENLANATLRPHIGRSVEPPLVKLAHAGQGQPGLGEASANAADPLNTHHVVSDEHEGQCLAKRLAGHLGFVLQRERGAQISQGSGPPHPCLRQGQAVAQGCLCVVGASQQDEQMPSNPSSAMVSQPENT